jgi:prepilin-type N-terminal cleavage/methylation domain-containing protein
MNRPKHQRNQMSGFTLLETMLVVGILAIVAMGISMMMVNLSKQQKHARDNADMISLATHMNAAAGDAESVYNSATTEITKTKVIDDGTGFPYQHVEYDNFVHRDERYD